MLKALKKQLKKTGYRPAKRSNGELFLTRLSSDPDVTFLSPETFVDLLMAGGRTISPKTLVISDLKKKTAPAKKPAKKKAGKKPSKVKPSELPTLAAVMKMTYNDLKSFAADHKVDIPKKVLKKDLQALVKKTLYP